MTVQLVNHKSEGTRSVIPDRTVSLSPAVNSGAGPDIYNREDERTSVGVLNNNLPQH